MALVFPAHSIGAADDLSYVSRASGFNGSPGDKDSRYASVSGDGRYVAFASVAESLSDEDGQYADIFVRDLLTGQTTLVSRADGLAGAPANGPSDYPSISADGRHVAFQAEASNLSSEHYDGVAHVYVRDLVAGTTTLATRATGFAGASATDHSEDASISGDGRYVAFTSSADDLSAEDGDGLDVFVRDLLLGTTTLVSRKDGIAGASAAGTDPSISLDGRYVAFSSGDVLTEERDSGYGDVYIRNLESGVTELVSRQTGPGGGPGDERSRAASVSANGRHVAFESTASNFADEPTYNANVYVRDRQAGTTTLVSRPSGTSGVITHQFSIEPAISADGRLVAFTSQFNGLTAEPDSDGLDVFLRDTVADTTVLASRASGASGAAGDSGSLYPAISGNGAIVTFHSSASNFSDEDVDHEANPVSDVFAREFGASSPPPEPALPGPAAPHGTAPPEARRTDASDQRTAPRDIVAPVVSRAAWTAGRFAAGRGRTARVARRGVPRGAKLRFVLSERADVRIRFLRVCRPSGSVRCGRTRTVGRVLRRRRPAGPNGIRFTGRLGSRPLAPGAYRAVVWATDASGNRSPSRALPFRLVRR